MEPATMEHQEQDRRGNIWSRIVEQSDRALETVVQMDEVVPEPT
jgi:hypothetical protein